ncbi:MAG: 3-hydroxyacyl-ACP dehydratase FabZ [Ruminococcaceae bacterium]|nr:3-hydroxyacyl-ACP dehydratase FabZ [Oscillospiraceae bacterium]
MNREELKAILPHREPMLLLDEAFVAEDGSARARCAIKGDEWFLQGHYPDEPVVPGVILCEMMGQTCGVLLGEQATDGLTPFFTGLDKVKFRRPVRPGDVLETECRIVRTKGPFYFAEGTGKVDGQLAVSANFSFALVEAK